VLVVFVVDHLLRWDDSTAALTVHGLAGGIGLLAVGIFADGRSGVGWNRVGTDAYLGVVGQGVTGLLAAPGFQPDWPGQMQAQLVGLAALALLGFFGAWIFTGPLASLIRLLGTPARTPIRGYAAEATPAIPPLARAAHETQVTIDRGSAKAEDEPSATSYLPTAERELPSGTIQDSPT
jgi:Amt family ammonium transporter